MKSRAIEETAAETIAELEKKRKSLQDLIGKTEERMDALQSGLTSEQLKEANTNLKYLKETVETPG